MNTFAENLSNLLYEELTDCISEELLKAVNSDDITWITVKGNHIPIFEGQSKSQAIKSFLRINQTTRNLKQLPE